MRSCRLAALRWLNDFVQWLQLNGFSPVWIRSWSTRLPRRLNACGVEETPGNGTAQQDWKKGGQHPASTEGVGDHDATQATFSPVVQPALSS